MSYQSVDRDNIREYEKTKRAQVICGTITTSIFLLSCTAVAISGQWADFAKKRADLKQQAEAKPELPS